MLKLKPLEAAHPWGAARHGTGRAGWQVHLALDVPTQAGCPDGFSRRAWRQLRDLATESGIVWHRQRPHHWRRALQLQDAWHTPSWPPGQHGQAWEGAGSQQLLHSS